MSGGTPLLRVGMVGYGFMGSAHSQGWRVAPRFFDLPAQLSMNVLVGRHADAVDAAANKWGWAETATDWRTLLDRDDIDIIDIVTPGDSHAEIAIAALKAGKHVLCEKPMSNTVAEAVAMTAAAEEAATKGVLAMVGYTYRRVPAATFARDLVAAGKIGEVQQVRASYLQDWLVDPTVPRSWRLQKELAGSGALGDIGAHAIDLAQFVTGLTLTSVSGTLETIIKERPLEGERTGITGTAGEGMGAVTVDDVACSLVASTTERSVLLRPRVSAPAARMPCASKFQDPRARSASTSKTSTPSASTTRQRRRPSRGSPESM